MKVTLKFDRKAIEEKILSSSKLRSAATEIVNRKIESAKAKFLSKYDEHNVTKEIIGGNQSESISGAVFNGNLFTFLGFDDNGENPAISLRRFLDQSISVNARFSKRAGNKMYFKISVPIKEDIESATPLPYESGRSWVRGIEYGVSGIGFYFYSKKEISASRSKYGIQSKNKTSEGSRFYNQSYLSPILREFYKELNIK